jgi:putative polyhydroxyalkanoate system protein
MADISIRPPHHMNHYEVKQQVEELARTLKNKLRAEYQWQDDMLMFSRKHALGYIKVSDEEVDIEVNLGLPLRPMKGSLEQMMTAYLDKHLR